MQAITFGKGHVVVRLTGRRCRSRQFPLRLSVTLTKQCLERHVQKCNRLAEFGWARYCEASGLEINPDQAIIEACDRVISCEEDVAYLRLQLVENPREEMWTQHRLKIAKGRLWLAKGARSKVLSRIMRGQRWTDFSRNWEAAGDRLSELLNRIP